MAYFKETERYQLEILLKDGYSKKELAERLSKSLATIYNEIKRGMTTLLNSDLTERTEYLADVAQSRYEGLKANKGTNYKIGNDYKLTAFIEDKIKNEKWSPETVIGYIKSHELDFKTTICFKTLYNYLDAGLFLNISNKDLQYKEERKKNKNGKKRKAALKNVKGNSIENRSEEINERKEYGHWEMDTVVSGKGTSNACLLVLSERMTRQEKIIKLDGKTQRDVLKALDEIEKEMGYEKFKSTYKSITMDNGVEFLDIDGIEKSVLSEDDKRTVTFYCHPYSSWERGTNENINKMIRRFIPKGSDIGEIESGFIKFIEDWINNYPRKIFGFKSSNEIRNEVA